VKAFEGAIQGNETNVKLLEHLGWAYFNVQNTTKAISYINKAIPLNNNDADLYYILGKLVINLD
jgi:tetratricopeptide (TPR) repeat protein